MKCEEMERLLPDYLQGSLVEDQRSVVEAHLLSCGQCREEVDLWRKLASLPQEQPSPESRARFAAMLDAYQEGSRQGHTGPAKRSFLTGLLGLGRMHIPAAGLAWAALLLMVGFVAGRAFNSRSLVDDKQSAQLARLQEDLVNTRELVTLSLLQQRSASERLQAIAQATSWSLSDQHPDPKVMDALVRTLRSDNNVDVRLAAVDALGRFHNDPQARQGLTDALQGEQSPLVQVALIDLLVELKDASIVQELKKFEGDPNVNPTVRQRAQWGIKKLT